MEINPDCPGTQYPDDGLGIVPDAPNVRFQLLESDNWDKSLTLVIVFWVPTKENPLPTLRSDFSSPIIDISDENPTRFATIDKSLSPASIDGVPVPSTFNLSTPPQRFFQ